MRIERKTLDETVTFEGKGLHSGDPVRVRVHPGEDGLAFRAGAGRTPALAEEVTDTKRSTRVGEVNTVEHLMSALWGLGITDAEIEVEGGEIPGEDGSAEPFVARFRAAGLASLPEREGPDLYRRLFFQEEGVKIAIAKGSGRWRYEYRIEDRWPGEQAYELASPARYAEEVAPARTFALVEEVPMVLQMGLGLGLDEHSCLVLGPQGYKNEPRFPDEPARHKLLDLIGDLALSGVPVGALDVVAERSGHRTHVGAARMLRQALAQG